MTFRMCININIRVNKHRNIRTSRSFAIFYLDFANHKNSLCTQNFNSHSYLTFIDEFPKIRDPGKPSELYRVIDSADRDSQVTLANSRATCALGVGQKPFSRAESLRNDFRQQRWQRREIFDLRNDLGWNGSARRRFAEAEGRRRHERATSKETNERAHYYSRI